MSQDQGSRGRAEEERYDDAQLLEWALDREARAAGSAQIDANGELRERLAEWEDTVDHLREAFKQDEPSASPLVDRILSRTTREDMTRGGDLRLVRGYFSRHYRSSWVMRLVAASLVIHLAALPILAYVLITQQESGLNIRVDPPEILPDDPDEPERPVIEVDVPDLPEDELEPR